MHEVSDRLLFYFADKIVFHQSAVKQPPQYFHNHKISGIQYG